MNSKSKVIAIDGPSGSGKSTIAKIVAEKLSLTYLDTGAMFRAVALGINQADISFEDINSMKSYLSKINFEYGVSSDVLIQINGVNFTEKIREHDVSTMASIVSKYDFIRNFLKEQQRKIAMQKPSILEGRDIGTVIFPNAALKYYLNADPKIRAKRRFDQLVEKDPSLTAKYSEMQILKDIETRDFEDENREVAPLKRADDALILDTTSMDIDQVVDSIIVEFNKRINLFR